MMLVWPSAHVGVLVTPVQDTLRHRMPPPPAETVALRALLMPVTVTVCPAEVKEFASKTASSCASGMGAPLAPPLVSDQCAVEDQSPPLPTQYTVREASNVMPVFIPRSPSEVPVNGAAAPVPAML